MEIAIKFIAIVALFCCTLIWLDRRRKRVKATIEPSLFQEKPILSCDIGNYFGVEPITIVRCQLIVDNQISSIPVSQNIRLPHTIKVREGIGLYFDAVPLLLKARENGQQNFKTSVLFQDSANRSYISKSITIPTNHQRFTRMFEDVWEHYSEPLTKALNAAEEVTEQLDQQYVEIPQILLGLIREQNGVAGHVLRKVGLREDFLFNLAKHMPNSPRDYKYPQTHRSMDTHKLIHEYMRNEALKMRQKCFGTGHLLLGLIGQRDATFLIILKQLKIYPRQLRMLVYQALRNGQYEIDHPTLPPEGIKRFIWAIWYQFTHGLVILFFRVIEWLYPDFEI